MSAKTAAVLLSGLLAACAQMQPQVAATPPAPPPTVSPATAPNPPPAPAPNSAPTPNPAPGPSAEAVPPDRIVDIRGARCQDLLRLSPDDRAAAAMFYIGYQASLSRARTVNVSLIPSVEAQAYTYCQQKPDRPVVQAFAEAYLRTGR